MKLKLTILNLLLCLLLNAQTPHLSLYDAGVYDGRTYYRGFSIGRPETLKGMLPANSAVLNYNTSGMDDASNFNADWISNSNNYSLGGFVTFKLHTGKAEPKAQHLFSIGINYLQGNELYKYYSQYTPFRVDTLYGPNQVPYAYVDSVKRRSVYFDATQNKLLVNLDYQISTNPKTKLGVSVGFGIGLGFTIVNLYEAVASQGYGKYVVNPNSYGAINNFNYIYGNYGGTYEAGGHDDDIYNETGKTRAAFVARPYIPLTLSYRLSNKSKFLKNVTVFGMFKVGREFMVWGKGTRASSLFYERSLGLRYRINQPNKKILKVG